MRVSPTGNSHLQENLLQLKQVGEHLKRLQVVCVTQGHIKNLGSRATIPCEKVTLLTSLSAKYFILLEKVELLIHQRVAQKIGKHRSARITVAFALIYSILSSIVKFFWITTEWDRRGSRNQRSRGPKSRSAAARLLELWVESHRGH